MKQKLLSILALLLMTATGAWAQADMKKTPLTLEAKTAGTIVVENPPAGMKYKKNDEEKTAVTSAPINVVAEDEVQFFGNITSYGTNNVSITTGTADCYIYGNIMSLVDEENFATATELTDDNTFQELFKGCTNLYSHPTNKLVLPATTLTENCYRYMFVRCENLTVAPELPATTLADDCYDSMFDGCTSLTTAPALPATTLETYCYYNMFYGCTSLTVAPELPATTLAYGCYAYMFEGCTSLTTAPALPATTLETRCYNNMFKGCTKLNSVTCLATNISASNATTGWLSGVSDAGTFTKAAGMTGWTSDGNGIPDGWTKNNIATLTDGSSIADQLKCPGESCTLTYTRAFTADKPSTVCLPFAYAPKTGETFYTFSGITKEGDKYVATMTEHTGATLAANTPYLYKSAATGDTDFSGTYTMPATISAGETASGDWKFVGTYETQEWTTAPTGIYGFSAQATTGGISQGEFVKVGAYVKVKPMRAYLKYKDGGENYAGAPTMAPRHAAEVLPERISVRLIDAEGNVTGIGTLETRTGEVTLDGWYTLDGTRLSGQPTQKGIYVNNGKKVVIK